MLVLMFNCEDLVEMHRLCDFFELILKDYSLYKFIVKFYGIGLNRNEFKQRS